MALYGAMYEILVSEGPLDGLFLDRLPDEQVHEVDVVHISQGGPPPQRYLGSSPVMNGPWASKRMVGFSGINRASSTSVGAWTR